MNKLGKKDADVTFRKLVKFTMSIYSNIWNSLVWNIYMEQSSIIEFQKFLQNQPKLHFF